MVVMDAVDEEVQPRADSALGLEAEHDAVQPVLGQRPQQVADGDQPEHGQEANPPQGEHEAGHDHRRVEHDRHQMVHAREPIHEGRPEERRRGLQPLRARVVGLAGHAWTDLIAPPRRRFSDMYFELDDDHRLLQRTVRDFAENEVAPVAEALDREKRFPYDLVAKMGELGWMGIPFPEEVGGAGGDALGYALAVEELTRVDSSVAITMCAHTSLGTQPVYLFGDEAQKARLLPDLCSGRRLGAFGLTEPEAGSDAGNVRTRAVLDGGGGWVVNGAKQFITNAGTSISGHVAITARTDPAHPDEIPHLIVETGTPGYEQGEPYRKMGWNASDTRPLTFTDCVVPEENLLGPRGQGFKQFLHILDIGRIGVAAMGVGLAQGALDEALAYAKERKAFGQPISKFQAIQGKL